MGAVLPVRHDPGDSFPIERGLTPDGRGGVAEAEAGTPNEALRADGGMYLPAAPVGGVDGPASDVSVSAIIARRSNLFRFKVSKDEQNVYNSSHELFRCVDG